MDNGEKDIKSLSSMDCPKENDCAIQNIPVELTNKKRVKKIKFFEKSSHQLTHSFGDKEVRTNLKPRHRPLK